MKNDKIDGLTVRSDTYEHAVQVREQMDGMLKALSAVLESDGTVYAIFIDWVPGEGGYKTTIRRIS